ncbi:outer membrane protein OmpK [Moritella viscosa]|uniref:Outer membrane protein ompK n=1 Tax=Moritella viscosa TaxID=80854 RepID=A0ABY1HEJ0_9GAMM|nr:outer membrane protein OmpK [Moritella viscosa]SGY89932.1 Putative outer membrane protein ompK [Moritella viscosa]SGY98724.1 Putative outer membrane protein ompK [Moritella viscosa]SHO25921.1 Putative outer membrane protein ompK [Moritella viscosa]
MNNIYKLLLLSAALVIFSNTTVAADYSDGLHKKDYRWMQFNMMYAVNEKPSSEDNLVHDYLELEFGGRSGIFDLYGYVDVFNLANTDSTDSDKINGASKLFMKLAPRFSLDAMTGKDLSFGPVQEVYIATLFNWGGGGITGTDSNGGAIVGGVNNSFWGVGSDVSVPWFGKVGMNLYGLYDLNAKDWNGFQFSMNWFKPFVTFDNDSFIAYQGYVDYQFSADAINDLYVPTTTHGGVMFNGIYWHSARYSLGYGVKIYKDVYTIEDGGGIVALDSSGFAHYFAVTYKF